MKDTAHTYNGRGIAPARREATSTPSERQGMHKDTPDAPDAPGDGKTTARAIKAATERIAALAIDNANTIKGDGKPTTPRHALKAGKTAARALEASASLIVAAIGRMQTARRAAVRDGDKSARDEVWTREWREITLNLEEYANAMLQFLGCFIAAPCFRRIAEAAHERDIEERKAAMVADFNAEDADGGAAK